MFIFDQNGLVSDGSVDVDGDAAHSRGSLGKDEPLPFFFGEV